MKTLYDAIIEKKFASYSARNKWLRTQKVRVIDNENHGHNYKIGEILKLTGAILPSVTNVLPTSSINQALKADGSRGNSIYLKELAIGDMNEKYLKETIKDLKDQKKEIDNKIKDYNDRIAFIKEKGIKVFDEGVYKNWKILKEINANMDKLDSYEFAESLTKLING